MTDDREDPDNDPLLKSMRSVWLGMRDEEPPAGGLAELMAAARVQADKMRPAESWWRKSFALLVRPPVLAAATVIVVVGGAIALNRRGVDTVATPPAVVESERATQLTPKPDLPKDESATGLAAGSATVADDRSVRAQKPPVRPAVPPPQKKLEENTVVKETPPPPPPPPPSNDQQPRGGEEGLVIAGESPASPKSKVEKKPAEAPRERPEPTKLEDAEVDGAPTMGRAPAADHAPTRTVTPTDQLVKQAELAASRNDCPAVRATAERVKKSDPSAYKSRLTTKPAIARCLK